MDPQQFLTELDSELRSILGEFLATAPTTTSVAATDDSGRVRVTLHPDRTLARVQVAADWENEIEGSALAATILEVAAMAQTGAPVDGDGAGDAAAVDPQDVEAARDALLREKGAELMAPVGAAELQQQIDDLPALLERLDAQLDDAIEKTARLRDDDLPRADAVDEEQAQGEVVESENRMVSIRVIAGHLGDVRIKESWLEGRSGIAVTQCFDQIMHRIADQPNDEESR